MVKQSDEPSAFLWADGVVKREKEGGGEGEQEVEEQARGHMIVERSWTSDRMRRIM